MIEGATPSNDQIPRRKHSPFEAFFGFDLIIATLFLAFLVLRIATSNSLPPRLDEPFPRLLCSGFNQASQSWGPIDTLPAENCADGHAIVGEGFISGNIKSTADVKIRGWCCPLPNGALSDKHSYHAESCPDGSVATGVRTINFDAGAVVQELRCTNIAQDRFSLGEKLAPTWVRQHGWVPTKQFALRYFFGISEPSAIFARMVPPEYRYGLGRLGEHTWAQVFCAGVPWGSPLVEKRKGKGCPFLHQVLTPRNMTEVSYERCSAIADPFSDPFHCVNE